MLGARRHALVDASGFQISRRLAASSSFTRVSADRIDYEMTIEDPEIQADKWTISYPMFLDPQYQFYEYACHEDNTAVRNFIATSQYERGLRPAAH
jgi:hypothetical protein